MNNDSPCILCKDKGMVERPGGNFEDGFWEACPICYPDVKADNGEGCIMVGFTFVLVVFLIWLSIGKW